MDKIQSGVPQNFYILFVLHRHLSREPEIQRFTHYYYSRWIYVSHHFRFHYFTIVTNGLVVVAVVAVAIILLIPKWVVVQFINLRFHLLLLATQHYLSQQLYRFLVDFHIITLQLLPVMDFHYHRLTYYRCYYLMKIHSAFQHRGYLRKCSRHHQSYFGIISN